MRGFDVPFFLVDDTSEFLNWRLLAARNCCSRLVIRENCDLLFATGVRSVRSVRKAESGISPP